MRTSHDLANALTERLKNAMKNAAPEAPADRRGELHPGKRYRDERGRMVTIIRCSQLRVLYHREGYRGDLEVSRREFDLKFTEVKS